MTPDDIRDTRLRLGLTQAEAAALVGVSPDTWYSWESGRRFPAGDGPAHLKQLSELASQDPRKVPAWWTGPRHLVVGEDGQGLTLERVYQAREQARDFGDP